ncbi:MAG: hypothetical protein OJF50_001386 [Nitrospira sp.]|nr:hypothetical protein [Nitrospira sp.]
MTLFAICNEQALRNWYSHVSPPSNNVRSLTSLHGPETGRTWLVRTF